MDKEKKAKKEKKVIQKREPYLWEALLALVILVVVLSFSLVVLKVEAHIPFIVVLALTAFLAVRMGITWEEIEKKIIESLTSVLQAVIILIMVGLVIGSWIQGGIVPSLIYYGMEIINPKFFLVTIFLVCCIGSIATGSSWTIVGTLGVAAMGISGGLGIPLHVTAGIVVSAGYVGDKFSPLSDTSNLQAALCKVSLFDHVKSLLYTTIPSFIISLIMVIVVSGWYAPSDSAALDSITLISSTLKDSFFIHPLLMTPVLLVFVMILFKIPPIPGIVFMAFVGSVCAVTLQGATLSDTVTALHYGYSADTGVEVVNQLLSRGGLNSMMGTVSLIFCAISYGGVLEASGILKLLVEKLLKLIHRDGDLITTTVLSCIVLNMVAVDNYVTSVIASSMFGEAFENRGMDRLNLSRCLGESAAITSPLIPWNTCGIVMVGMLGVSPVLYAPYAFLCWVPPIVTIIMGYLKIGIIKLRDKNTDGDTPNSEVVNVS